MRRLSKPMRVAVLFTVAVLLFAQNIFVLDAKAESIAVYSCDFEDGKDGWQTHYGGTTTVSADQSVSGTHSLKMTNRSQPWHSPGKNIYSIVKKCGTGTYYVNMCVYVTKVKEDFPHMGFLLRTTKENSFSKSDAVGNYFCRLQNVYNISANRWITVYGSFTVTEEDISASSGEFNLMIDVLEPVDGQEVYIDSVNLIKDVDNSNFSMSSSPISIYEGETYQLQPNPDFGVKYQSDNENIAKVNSYGVVTGVSCGETVVYAIRGNQRRSCTVKVDYAPNVAEGTYFFENVEHGIEMQVNDNDAGNNYSTEQEIMELWPLSGEAQQRWTIQYVGGSYYKIINGCSGKALSVKSGNENSDNKALIQETYSGSDRQKWKFISLPNGYYKIKPKSSTAYANDWCIVAGSGISSPNGRNVEQRKYTDEYIAQWRLIKYYGELSYWEDDEQSTEIGVWNMSPKIYTKQYTFGDMRFNFSDMTKNAINQWNDALGLSMQKTSNINNAQIEIYGDSDYKSLGEIIEGDLNGLTLGLTVSHSRFAGIATYKNRMVVVREVVEAKTAIVQKDRLYSGYVKTTTHELGHALGFFGHITSKEVGVMRQGDTNDYELTTYDVRHLKQLY